MRNFKYAFIFVIFSIGAQKAEESLSRVWLILGALFILAAIPLTIAKIRKSKPFKEKYNK